MAGSAVAMICAAKMAAFVAPGLPIAVQDTGPGISREHRPNLFNAHFSTKPGNGRGIGLSLVRQIVQAHHGKICFSTGRPFGSCFQVILPCFPPLKYVHSSI